LQHTNNNNRINNNTQIIGTLVPASAGRAPLSSRLLSRVRLATMSNPEAAEMEAICTHALREVCRVVLPCV